MTVREKILVQKILVQESDTLLYLTQKSDTVTACYFESEVVECAA